MPPSINLGMENDQNLQNHPPPPVEYWRDSDIFPGGYNSTGGIRLSFLGV